MRERWSGVFALVETLADDRPRFHGPWKPMECWHEGVLRCVLTIEEGLPTVHHVECGLPVSLPEPAELEMHAEVEVDAEWHVERDYYGEIDACYLLLTPAP